MSAIDDLKNGIVIDTMNGDDSASVDVETEGISIDTTDDSSTNVVDLSGLGKKKKYHTVVMPKDKSQDIQSSQNRRSVDVSAISIDTTDDEDDIHISLEKDLLDTSNPNSALSIYLAKEEKEAAEWIAEKQEEAATLKAEEEDEKALLEEENSTSYFDNATGSLVIDFEANDDEDEDDTPDIVINSDIKTEDIDVEDISFMSDEKEEDSMSEVEVKATDDLDELIPDEVEDEAQDYNVLEEEEMTEEEVPEFRDTSDEEPAPAPSEPERYDAPDGIDAEIEDGLENFATEIVEDDETATIEANTDADEVLKNLQRLATEKLKPVSKSLDISSFTIIKKPVTNVSAAFESQKARVAKWVLPAQESIVLMKEFSGAELEKLREYSENNKSVDSLNRRFKLIYDHIVSPKPQSFEQWLKTTPYEDVDNYFFAIYVASFKGANYLPADCINQECKETFLSDDIKIMDMVKFENKEAQKKFATLYQSEATTAGKGVYCTEVVPLSDKIAVSFRDPSIYNVFEIAGIDDRTRATYASIVEYIPYIDTIYLIDSVEKTLTPVTYKMYPDNASRTVRSKIQKYDNIFNTLSVDEFGPIKAYISALAEKTQDMYYVYPEIACPKCGHTTEETRATAEELVFTRYQLGALVTTSLS